METSQINTSAQRWMRTHGVRLYDDALAPLAMGLLIQTTRQDATPNGPAYVFDDRSALINDVTAGAMVVVPYFEPSPAQRPCTPGVFSSLRERAKRFFAQRG